MPPDSVLYWDSSAVLSALVKDRHSDQAWESARKKAYHLISSLVVAEVHAVLNRMNREGYLADILVKAALEAFSQGPWRLVRLDPLPSDIASLARKWPLRGADLWHLALAVRLKQDLPELRLLTFDRRLNAAAWGEGLWLSVGDGSVGR
ncbi:MAG TPA: type II toxin-antitoxin system VapC family toxin [Syntrophothermus lipocalidus]|mgnify:CR=1 FL=1|nr:type II toxin-antitoxin system VapC family toxin [Syntrophothermus lipocalidus]